MPVVIRAGQTKTVVWVSESCSWNTTNYNWNWRLHQNGDYQSTYAIASDAGPEYQNPKGFNVTSGGAVSVPLVPTVGSLPKGVILNASYLTKNDCTPADPVNPDPGTTFPVRWRRSEDFIIGCLANDPGLTHTVDSDVMSVTATTPGHTDPEVSFTWYRLPVSDPTYSSYDPTNPATYGAYIGSTREIGGLSGDEAMFTCIIALNECYDFGDGWIECYPLCEEVANKVMSSDDGPPPEPPTTNTAQMMPYL